MDIIAPDVRDDRVVDELIALRNDVARADTPERPVPCAQAFRASVRRERPWTRHVRRVARADDRSVGYLTVGLPLSANTHLAEIEIEVHPDHRRRGIGRALMRAGAHLAEQHQRRTLTAGTLLSWEDGPRRSEAGELFLQREGFRPALTEVLRTLDLEALDVQREAGLLREAEERSVAYETVAWTGRVPEYLLDAVGALDSIFLEQAPTGDLELERDPVGADRIRQNNQDAIDGGMFLCGVVAVDPSSGAAVANTQIGVHAEPGDWAEQHITLVHPDHRGHRLGLRVKLENHRQLRTHRPDVRRIETGNAASNEHMIGINRTLGFHPLDAWREYQREL